LGKHWEVVLDFVFLGGEFLGWRGEEGGLRVLGLAENHVKGVNGGVGDVEVGVVFRCWGRGGGGGAAEVGWDDRAHIVEDEGCGGKGWGNEGNGVGVERGDCVVVVSGVQVTFGDVVRERGGGVSSAGAAWVGIGVLEGDVGEREL
jgi:hypothetical protein